MFAGLSWFMDIIRISEQQHDLTDAEHSQHPIHVAVWVFDTSTASLPDTLPAREMIGLVFGLVRSPRGQLGQ